MNFKDWFYYFEGNQEHFNHIKWEGDNELTEQEKKIITSSLQQFQKGENSEGKNLYRYAKELNDESYLETIKLFIKEEKSHAQVLGRFMEQNKIPKIKSHWIDDTFRNLRKLFSLENSIIVLVTAEIVAVVYYKALQKSTNSNTLKEICQQILVDEEMHINFQSFTLRKFYFGKNYFYKKISRLFHTILMSGTFLVVWIYHRKVLKKGGFTFTQYLNAIFKEFYRASRMVTGKKTILIKTLPNRVDGSDR
ncbi:MAG: hypothetical protein MI974_07325 [Chitinophagales bacterium]|nr:hypothetical protein [Chitinophagales bacterium]